MISKFSEWLKKATHINEQKDQKFEYGCLMVYYDFPEMSTLHSQINEEDIYTQTGDRTYGLETEPHTTLLFGFHDTVDPEDLFKICKNYEFRDLLLHNSSCFENQDYDVLKFDTGYKTRSGAYLHSCHNKLKEFPHTTNFPDYRPHSTIGYLKKGKGQHYAGLFNKNSYSVTPNRLVYSMPSGERIERPIVTQRI
jgi:hypothetical protein